MKADKEKEIATTTTLIEDKTTRRGQTRVQIVNVDTDLKDTSVGFAEDKDFLLNMDKNCAQKQKDYDVVKISRGNEITALADTIKILNDDDALDLFKKTIPSPSFLQLEATSKRKEALGVLHKAGLDFLALAVRGKKFSFKKVLTMIDAMTKNLKAEQVQDDKKQTYCTSKIVKAEDEGKDLATDISALDKAIAKTIDSSKKLGTE